MLKLRPLLLLTLFAVSLLSAPEARADPVVVTGGAINGNFSGDTVFLSPSGNGFRVDFFPFGYPTSFRFDTCTTGGASAPCGPGQTANGSANVSLGAGPPASVTLNGIQFTNLALQDTTLRFETAGFTLPNLLPDTGPGDIQHRVSVPFTMTGTIVAGNWNEANGLRDGPPIFTFDLSGAGRALIDIRQDGNRFLVTFVSYQFQPQPVPEPATIIFFGTSVAGLAAHLRRRRRCVEMGRPSWRRNSC